MTSIATPTTAPAPITETIGDLLDRLTTMDLKGRGAVDILYREARRQAGQSLTMRAAQEIKNRVSEGDIAILCTGFPVRPWISELIGETDGPPGVAALARAISTSLRGVPLITTPPGMRDQVIAALRGGGVLVLDPDAARRAASGSRPTCAAAVVDFPTDAHEAMAAAENLMTTYRPSLVAALEHPGANRMGVYHSSVGVDISAGAAKVEALFSLAASLNTLTMSFIDMPNEIGAAHIAAVAEAASPFAHRCTCPCNGGTLGASNVDILVVGATVNWAAYATVAALGVLLNDTSILVTQEHDRRSIEAVQWAGSLEGVTGSIWPAAGVDNIPAAMSSHVVELIRMVADDAIRRAPTERY
ncbi:MAG: glutamate cyclase domain-containing protein [Pseudolabrys sp.]|jgi:hypothetical protein